MRTTDSSATHVAIIGAGVVGRATGRGFENAGCHVSYFDIDTTRIAQLQAQGVNALEMEDLRYSRPDFYLVSVPTPSFSGRSDRSRLLAACTTIASSLAQREDWSCVVIRSTVLPGTTEDLVVPLLAEVSGKRPGVDFGVAMNPEFLRELSAYEDFMEPRVIVIGVSDERSQTAMEDLYSFWASVPMRTMNPRTAESTKYISNVFNATKISFFNEIQRILGTAGVDVATASSVAAEGAEGLWNPLYGTRGGEPFGGACLPKDLEGFLGFIEDLQLTAPLLSAVKAVNDAFERDASTASDFASTRGVKS